jgi:Ca-activated chloride channel family protein
MNVGPYTSIEGSSMRRRHAPFLLIALIFVGTGVAALPQDAQVFRAESELVVLHVNVFDDRSDAVPELPQTAFQVIENGKPQDITFFSGEDVPVAAGLIIDNSGSMIARHRMVRAGSLAFVTASHPEDELFTIMFNNEVLYGLPDRVAFSNSEALLRAAVARYPAGGKTALYDAVIAGLDHVERGTHQKHVLVVLSDGDDNASRHSEDEMFDRVRRSDAIIYVVSNADRRVGYAGRPGLLKKLAELGGGVAYFPKSEDEVVSSLREVAENIRRGYSIGYAPAKTAGDAAGHDGFRRVTVTVRAPGRGKLNVRSRSGYFLSHSDSGAQ